MPGLSEEELLEIMTETVEELFPKEEGPADRYNRLRYCEQQEELKEAFNKLYRKKLKEAHEKRKE